MSEGTAPSVRAAITVVVLAALALVLALPCAVEAADTTTPVSPRTVRVGLYQNAPKIFTADSGTPSGIFADIIESIAKAEGWTLQWVPGTFAEGLTRLERGEIDLMPDVAYTAERESVLAFHNVSVLSSWSQVYARHSSGIESLLSLDGLRVAVLAGSIQEQTFARLAAGFGIDVELVSVPDFDTMFTMVGTREVDAAITNRFYGMLHARKAGLEDTAIVFDPTELFFAASPGDPRGLLPTIDTHLVEMKSNPDSVYYASLRKWTSEPVGVGLPRWVPTLAITLGVALLTSLIAGFILRHQVRVRTEELRLANQEMEQRIIERTAELADATTRAQEADHLKSAFLATMSHELRTPLNSIIGFTGIMLQGLAGPLNEEQTKQMTMVQKSARHLLALINDVLDISKIEAGELVLSPSTFDLGSAVDKVIKIVSPLADSKGIELRTELPDDFGKVTTDQRRLEQVILNLLTNAVKFTERGEVIVTGRVEDGDCELSITDTGIGMEPEELQYIFQPFRQVDSSLTRKHEGTGLGLSICRRILETMGGSIAVKSSPGSGSTFTIRFPKEAEVAA